MASGSVRALDVGINKTLGELEKRESDLEASVAISGGSSRKSGGSKESGHSVLSSVTRLASQIKKPPHRKNASPLNWFPRKKTDSYLKRKIRHLQEVGGMNLSLDETLGDANPHYTRIAREKIAARKAARKAMEARKAAMVEASWCRILQAARIQSKEAEAELEKAEKYAAEAFEAARAMGVMMYDKPDCPRRPWEIETSSATEGRSTHTVTASFETAFEVDKEVAAAVKKAFLQLANCPSSNKEEFKDLIRKISQNPDSSETEEKISEMSSDCQLDCRSDPEPDTHAGDFGSVAAKKQCMETKAKEHESGLFPTEGESSCSESPTKLINMMLGRLEGLQEEELASLATIVATCGLSATLLEVESSKDHGLEPVSSCTSSLRTGDHRYSITHFMDEHRKRKKVVTEVPGLDKFLVKHVSRLEREVQEAKNSKKSNSTSEDWRSLETSKTQVADNRLSNSNAVSSESTSDLGSILVKHVSKLEKEILEAKKTSHKSNPISLDEKTVDVKVECAVLAENGRGKSKYVPPPSGCIEDSEEQHSSHPEKELNVGLFENLCEKECKQLKGPLIEIAEQDLALHEAVRLLPSHQSQLDKENIDSHVSMPPSITRSEILEAGKHTTRVERARLEVLKSFSLQERDRSNVTQEYVGLDKILVKPVHRLEKEKSQALEHGSYSTMQRDQRKQSSGAMPSESLDKILVKHVSRLEKEKLASGTREEGRTTVKGNDQHVKGVVDSLDEIMVKHQSKLERAKLAAAQESSGYVKPVNARREARERELQEAWGGLSLGNSIRPHLSRLQRDKAAWRRAEEEERTREMAP